ncbi:MAG: hypothetical protein P8Y93_07045 [Acidobacteriota bacterium]
MGFEVVLRDRMGPENYLETHQKLGTWDGPGWQERIQDTLGDEKTRTSYN